MDWLATPPGQTSPRDYVIKFIRLPPSVVARRSSRHCSSVLRNEWFSREGVCCSYCIGKPPDNLMNIKTFEHIPRSISCHRKLVKYIYYPNYCLVYMSTATLVLNLHISCTWIEWNKWKLNTLVLLMHLWSSQSYDNYTIIDLHGSCSLTSGMGSYRSPSFGNPVWLSNLAKQDFQMRRGGSCWLWNFRVP